MPDKIKTTLVKAADWRTWLRGLVGAIIGGGANAITIMLVDPTNFNFESGWPKLWHFTAASALISSALFLKQTPVPPISDENT